MTVEERSGESPPGERFGFGTQRLARLRHLISAIWLAPLLSVLALGSWALASPVGSSPDDEFHLVSTWCADSGDEFCLPGPTAETRVVPAELIRAPCFAFAPEQSASCQAGLFDHDVVPNSVTERGNFQKTYPPVFYSVMGMFAGSDVPSSVVVMRVVNVLIFTVLASILFWLLPAARRSTLVWGWLITMVPLGVFLIASNNPSGWAISGVGSTFLATLGYLEAHGRRRIAFAVVLVVATLMAAGARGDASLYAVIAIGAALALKFSLTRSFFVTAIVPSVVAVLALAFLMTSSQVGSGLGGLDSSAASESAPLVTGLALFAYNALNVAALWTGTLGSTGLGWLDTSMPAIVTAAANAAFVAIGFVGLRIVTRSKLLVVLGLTALLAGIPLYILQRGGGGIGADVQPRYLLPLIVVLAFVLVFDPGMQPLAVGRTQRWLIVVALSLAHAVALASNIRRYVTGTDGGGLNLSANAEWWWDLPVTPMGVWATGSLAFAGLVTILIHNVASTPSREPLSA